MNLNLSNNEIEIKEVYFSAFMFAILIAVTILPVTLLIFIINNKPEIYSDFVSRIPFHENTFLIIAIVTFVFFAYLTVRENNNKIIINKQKIILQYFNISKYIDEYCVKNDLPMEFSLMYKIRIQLLNKQINSEETRKIPIDSEFLEINKNINRNFEKKLLLKT